MDDQGLTEKLSAWIGKTGYALEMRVAAAFQAEGFTVLQSDSYLDPDTNEAREIDVLAYKSAFLDPFVIHVNFVIECKNSPEKPWVMFMGSDTMPGSFLLSRRIANGLGKSLLAYFARSKGSRALLPQVADHRAYGVTEAFGNEGPSASHKAVLSATKAALAGAKAATGKSDFPGINACEIFLPLIVLDGRLAHVSLDKATNQPHFMLADEGTLIHRHPVGLQIVDVVAASKLANYVRRASQQCDALLAFASDHVAAIDKHLRKHPDYFVDDD